MIRRILALFALFALAMPARAQMVSQGAPRTDIPTQVINVVSQYSAVCDGSTDTQPQIAAALAAAAAGPIKAVFFPPSTTACMMGSNVTIPAGVTLWAYPGTATIKPTAGNVAAPVLIAMGSNTLIYGLIIDGGGQDFGTANNVVQAFTVTGAVLDNVTVQHTRGIGFLASTSIVNSGVRNSIFTDVGNHWKTTQLTADRQQAVAFCCGVVANSRGNFVTDNYFINIGLDAIQAFGQDFTVTSNRFDMANGQLAATWTNPQPTAFGAALYSSGGTVQLTVTGNTANGAQGNCFDLSAVNITVTGNNANLCGQAGIGIFAAGATSNATVTGNVAMNNSQWTGSAFKGGFALSGALGSIAMDGNTATDTQGSKTQQYGVQVVSGSTFNELRIDPSNSFAGNATSPFGGIITSYTSGATRDNRVVNPCFAIDGPNEGAAYAAGGGNRLIMEGWQATQSFNAFTEARSAATAMPGCGSNSLLATVTGTRSPGAADTYSLVSLPEGIDMQDLAYGTATAQSVVLDFCARTSVAGTYAVSVHNTTGPRSYVIPYTISANTMTCYSFVVPPDTVQAISTVGYPLTLVWDMGAGTSSETATPNTWVSANASRVSGETIFVSSANTSTFNLSSVRLFKGGADVGWIPRTTAEELALTQRRYRKTFPIGTAVAQSGGVAGALCTKNPIAVGDPSAFWSWGTTMRVAPTITTFNPSAANANWRDVTAVADVTVSVDPATALSSGTGVLIATSATVATLGDVLCIHATADAR
jgi:hypothetical protein